MYANVLWHCEKKDPTRGRDLSLWICQGTVSTQAITSAKIHGEEIPQSAHIRVCDTTPAAHEHKPNKNDWLIMNFTSGDPQLL